MNTPELKIKKRITKKFKNIRKVQMQKIKNLEFLNDNFESLMNISLTINTIKV